MLQAMLEGSSVVEVAKQLKVSLRTVYRRVKAIRKEVAAHNSGS